MPSKDLYSLPADRIDFEVVRQFVLDAEEADMLTESLTLELKSRRDRNNVAEAVGALSNSDGGLVLVGVAEDATGDARFVGVSQRDFDHLISSLQGHLPNAMPEVIAVRLPQKDRLVIVVRVDADAVLHPVAVAGRVMFRVPGQSVPADRGRIVDLVNRDRVPQQEGGRFAGHAYSIAAPSDFPLWQGDDGSIAALRLAGGLHLPQRILNSPWLTTPSRDAALNALQASAVPNMCWGTSQTRTAPTWRIIEARSTTLRLRTPVDNARALSAGDVPLEASAFLQLAGRRLSMFMGLRWYAVAQTVREVSIADLYAAVLAQLVAVSTTCESVARALGADSPTELLPWEGWLQSSTYRVPTVVAVDEFPRDGNDHPHGATFPRSTTESADTEALDALARSWVTVMLLDAGVRDFETWFDALPKPDWLATSPITS
ncbi:ATP-binding protein [Kribbella sp. NPDC051718]|uniref:AlbA family DNA-binding domain-containing protein n=1 Tax=Kribbella sp. NPDC051718 TaxID=3155168 RepID=UPI003440AE23